MSRASRRHWLALGLIAAAQFMVIMDTSIIGVALPKMQGDLGFDPQDVSWVFNAYVVAFGGLLLLGGRLSDLLGARIFLFGWSVLAAGSVIVGLRPSARIALAVAWWAGPSSWVWGAVYAAIGSSFVATLVALVLCCAGILGWTWALMALMPDRSQPLADGRPSGSPPKSRRQPAIRSAGR